MDPSSCIFYSMTLHSLTGFRWINIEMMLYIFLLLAVHRMTFEICRAQKKVIYITLRCSLAMYLEQFEATRLYCYCLCRLTVLVRTNR